VLGFDVRVQQVQPVVIALSPFRSRHDDLGLCAVAEQEDRLRLDAMADFSGVADEVEARIAGDDSAALGVGVEGQVSPV
jgi:hypothetical protein